ncbi:MAG TPA: RNA polymerase subunit sigma-70 [Cytophagales bacterium]|nr:RNA polymerase subunit sigma-70 [Cytophagales bacterium]
MLRNFLIYKFRDAERASDMVQEAFVVLWQNCKNVTPEMAKAYVFKVAQNKFLNLLERDKVQQKHLDLQQDKSNLEDPEYQMRYQQYGERIQEAIDRLPEGQREVFLLNRIEKLSYAEIAETLGVSQKAIEKRMSKALKKMREILEEK